MPLSPFCDYFTFSNAFCLLILTHEFKFIQCSIDCNQIDITLQDNYGYTQ